MCELHYCATCQKHVEDPCRGYDSNPWRDETNAGYRDASACKHLLSCRRGVHGRPMLMRTESNPENDWSAVRTAFEMPEYELALYAPAFPRETACNDSSPCEEQKAAD